MQKLHILKASGRLKVFETLIQKSFEESIEKISKEIKLPSVDVVVTDNPAGTIPETGIGGYSATAHLLYINVDPESSNLTTRFENEIKSTLAHELHHCARWQGVGYGRTLLEAVISEGLADHFDIEINGGTPKPWDLAVQGRDLGKIKEKAKTEFTNEKYNHSAWFFGSEKSELPRWVGYSLGFDIVGNYMKKTGKTAAELVETKANIFI